MKFQTLLLAGATLATLGAFAGTAKAETVYTTVAPGTTVTTSSGPTKEYVHENYTAVGTRKVGMVGYHAYPLVASHVDSRSVRVKAPGDNVVFTTEDGQPIAAEDSTETTTRTRTPISYSAGGGSYYTNSETNAYRDPALNIKVHSGAAFNN